MVTGTPLGERYQPFGAHLQDPYSFYALARQAEPVFFSPSLGVWVVTRYADIRAVLRDPGTFSSVNALRPVVRFHPSTIEVLQQGYPLVASVPSSDGALHRRLREPVTRAFMSEKVDELVPFIRGRADALVDAFAADRRAELMHQFAYPLPVEVLARFDPAVQGFFRVASRAATVGGVQVPAGAELLLLYGSANRDEALTERPDEFDVTRDPTRHLAFGSGCTPVSVPGWPVPSCGSRWRP